MGRGRSKGSGAKAKKRKKVLVTPAERMHGKELTEPYRLLESLVQDYRTDLTEARIEILWRSGWRADADGWVQMVNVKKAGDVDKALSVKADYALLLNKENFPRLTERLKTIYLHHALCHMKPMIDSDGEQKQDDKGRKIWRIVKRHDVEQFNEIVKTYGPDSLNLNSEAKAAINDSQRPLLAAAERGSGNGQSDAQTPTDASDAKAAAFAGGDWRKMPLSSLALPLTTEEKLAERVCNLGELADLQAKHGEFWAKEFPRLRRGLVEDAWERFWQDHPEFCTHV